MLSIRGVMLCRVLPAVALLAGSAVVAQPASADLAPRPTAAVMLGDSFASGEGGRWEGNSKRDSGNRGNTDKAAYLDNPNGGADFHWYYDPKRVYEPESVDNACHRSLSAPIHQVKGFDKTINLACSGALNKHLWPIANGGESFRGELPQITRLAQLAPSHDIELIAVGVGGNDMGFANAIFNCIGAWAIKHYTTNDGALCRDGYAAPGPYGEDGLKDLTMGNLKQVFDNTVKTIKLVKQTMTAAGHPEGSYRIVLMGAPDVLPGFTGFKYGAGDRREAQCPFNGPDVAYIDESLVPALNSTMQAVAETSMVGFIEMSQAFDGHRLCEAGTRRSGEGGGALYTSGIDMEWVRFTDVDVPLTELFVELLFNPAYPVWLAGDLLTGTGDDVGNQGDLSESMHPNIYGQRAIGTCMNLWKDVSNSTRRYKCRNTPGSDWTGMYLSGQLPVTPYVEDTVDVPIGDTGVITRTQIVPASGYTRPGNVISTYMDIVHNRKGQLKVWLTSPSGKQFLIRDYNPDDTGAFVQKRFLFPHAPAEPGAWTLRIDDNTAGFTGVLRGWDINFY